MDVYANQDPQATDDRNWVMRAWDAALQGAKSLGDFLRPTYDNSASAAQIDQGSVEANRPETTTPLFDPADVAERARRALTESRPISGAPEPRKFTDEEREAQRAEEAERTRVTAMPLEAPAEQVPAILQPGAGGPPVFPEAGEPRMPGAKHLEQYEPPPEMGFAGAPAGTESRQRKARQDYIDQMTPRWQKDADWLDKITEDQVRKGLIPPGGIPRNLTQEYKARRWPMGGGSESAGLFHDVITKDMRNWASADKAAGDFNERLTRAMQAKRALGGDPVDIPSLGTSGRFKAPLHPDPQGRDVEPSDRYGRSRAQQVQEGVRPPTDYEAGPYAHGPTSGLSVRESQGAIREAQERWMQGQQPGLPQRGTAPWQPAPNIRGGVAPPPPATDMSSEAIAARAFPSAAQQPRRGAYQQGLEQREAAAALKREELASKEHIADTAAKAKVDSADVMAAARMKAADAKQVQQMTDRQFADAYERHIRTYQSLRKAAETDQEKTQVDRDFKPPSEWKSRYDKIMGGESTQQTPAQQSEQTNQQQQQQQRQPIPGPPPPGYRWGWDKAGRLVKVPIQ